MEQRASQPVFQAWSQFINSGEVSPAVKPMIAASWKRCYARVNPIQPVNPVRLNPTHLLSSQVASFDLISIARPLMEDIHQYVDQLGLAIVLVNSAGCLLDCLGDSQVIGWMNERGITPGAILTEELLGTNAIGLALAERTAVEVIGPEHYLHSLHPAADVATPLFDLSGRLMGVLGLVMPDTHHHPGYLALIAASGRAIEAQHQSDVLMAEQNSQLAQLNAILSAISDGILVWNAQRILLHANQAASRILETPIDTLLGRPVGSLFTFPPFIYEAIDQRKPLSEVEVSISDGRRSLTCLINLDFVFRKNEPQWIIVTLHTEKHERLVISSQASSDLVVILEDLPGESPQIQQVRNFATSASRTRASVLLRGETGTGKNTLANMIHRLSPRREGPFVALACSALPSESLARELRGYEETAEGRRTVTRPSKFELAQGGSLFLQDVDALPLDQQAILMNAVESGQIQPIGSHRSIAIDVRVLASTQVDLEKMVAQGSFRADLYYWLSTLMITLPPLRERPRDVILIAERILRRLAQQWGAPKITLEVGVISVFKSYAWPGNVRELEAVLGRATAQLGNRTAITLEMIPASMRYAVQPAPAYEPERPEVQSMLDIERDTILRAAQYCCGNVTLMAQTLQISRTTLWRRMREFGISPKDYRPTSHATR